MAKKQQPEEDAQVQVMDEAEQAESSQVESSQADIELQDQQEETPADEPQSHEELLQSLQDAQAKAEEHWNQLLRAKADMANMERRSERELENAHKYGLEKFVRELLPIKDSLEMGLCSGDGQELDPDQVREGVEMTLKMFADVVLKFGVTEIDPVGEAFNPDFHQAMTTQPGGEGVAANTILSVFQKGYLLNERLIRPAMVVVAK